MNRFIGRAFVALVPLAAPASGFAQQSVPASQPLAPVMAAPVGPMTTPIVEARAPVEPQTNVLREGTQITLRVTKEMSSKKNKAGQRVELRVANDVLVNNVIVLPKGTRAFGDLTLAKKSGAFGRAGRLGARLLYIENGTTNIPITGNFDDKGKSGTAATVAVAVLAGVFSAFVKGKNAVLAVDTEVTATVSHDAVF